MVTLTAAMRNFRGKVLALFRLDNFQSLTWPQICKFHIYMQARNNGRSMDNVRPECGVVRSNSYLASHFDQSLYVKEQTNLHLNS